MNENHSGAKRFHFLHDVRGKNDGFLAPDFLNHLADFNNLVGIQTIGWFVENKQIR